MLTASLKTVHVTLSLQEGVVREPLYRKYLVLLAGNRLSNLKAGMPPMEESTDTERDKKSTKDVVSHNMDKRVRFHAIAP